jgi:hypothetical protein
VTPLDFQAEIEAATTSWERADPTAALVEHVDGATWRVLLPGGSAHHVDFVTERGAYAGRCDCEAWTYGDTGVPCAHLCTLRKAEFGNVESDDGEPIRARPNPDLGAEADPEPEPVADGGREHDETREDYLAARADEVLRE